MSSPDENVERVERGLEAFNRTDAQAVLDFFDEDVEIYSSPSLANPGTYRGHEGFRQWLERWLEAWDGFTVEPLKVEAVGEHHVVADVHQYARGRGSGIDVEMRIGYMLDLGEERTRAFHLYPTLDEALTAAREREAAGT
jgi:ketosteroid isomerase-like protein